MTPPLRPAADRRWLPWVVWPALAVGLLFVGARVGLLTSTETRYAEVGREMLASGDWVVPTMNGAPHLEKPPFAYWALAATYRALGVGDVAAHVPGFLAGALTLLVLAGVLRRLADPQDPDARSRGAAGAIALATMPAFVVQSYLVMTEPWLVLATTLSGAAVLVSWRTDGRPGLRWTLALHAGLGLGLLVKGPAVFLVPVAGTVAAAVGARSLRVARPFAHPLGLLLFLAISVPWYLAADRRIPGLLDTYLTKRLVGAVVSSADFHDRPWWVVWAPLLGAAPWLLAVPGAIRRLARDGGRRGPLAPLLAMALAAPVFFTFSASRLPSYASPAYPWIAAIVAVGASLAPREPARGWPARLLRRPALAVGGAALVVLAAAVAVARPDLVQSDKPLTDALRVARAPGDELGAALQKDGVWGLLPFYAQEPVHFFAYPPRVGPPEAEPSRWAPERFHAFDDLEAWFRAPARRWLLIRASIKSVDRNPWKRLEASGPIFVLAKNARYAIVTNLPLPPAR